MQKNQLLKSPVHAALGAATFATDAAYGTAASLAGLGAYAVWMWQRDADAPVSCRKFEEGVEYGLGYFAAMYLYRWYFGN